MASGLWVTELVADTAHVSRAICPPPLFVSEVALMYKGGGSKGMKLGGLEATLIEGTREELVVFAVGWGV